jgi:predicted dehydrogenase
MRRSQMTDTRYRRASADEWETSGVGLLDYGLSIIGCHEIDQARFLISEIEADRLPPRALVTTPSQTYAGRPVEKDDTVMIVARLSRPTNVLQPYCNRADTHWYTMDKTTSLDYRNPPK